MARGQVRWFLGGYLLLRWILATLPGYVADVAAYKRWALFAARDGLTNLYRVTDFDYPPLYAYILWPLGKLYGFLSPEALASMGDSTLLTVLIKLPPLVFDLGIAWLLAWFARELLPQGWFGGSTSVSGFRVGPRTYEWAIVLPTFYLMNPAVLFDTAYWGQVDCVHSFFLLASFLTLPRRPWLAWVSITLATLMKPLGAPLVPLLFVLTLALHGWKRSALAFAAAGATALVALGPFFATYGFVGLLEQLRGDLTLLGYTSVNGHNLWWALGGWRNADAPFLGSLTATQVGLGLVGLFYLALLALAHVQHRRRSSGLVPAQVQALGMTVAFGFFMLSTHMHENHMFAVIPLALPLLCVTGPARRGMLLLFAALTLGVTSNLVLHDLEVSSHFPFTLGGASSVMNEHLKRPFFVAELWATRLSTLLNLSSFAVLLIWMVRRPGLLDRLDARVEIGPTPKP